MLDTYSKDHVSMHGREIFISRFKLSNLKLVVETFEKSENTLSLVEKHLVHPFPVKIEILPPPKLQSLWKDSQTGFFYTIDVSDQKILKKVDESGSSSISRNYLSIFWFLPAPTEEYRYSAVNFLKWVLRGMTSSKAGKVRSI
jgi:hypothetical protein